MSFDQQEEMTEEQAWAALEIQGKLQRMRQTQTQSSSGDLKMLTSTGVVSSGERGSRWPTRIVSAAGFEEKFAILKAEREAFYKPLALDMGKHLECLGRECRGYVYQWYGPLNLNAPGVGFVERPCKCERGIFWDQAEKEKANSAELKDYRYSILKGSGLPLSGKFEDCTLAGYASTANGMQPWYKELKAWFNREWIAKGGKTNQGAVLLGSFGVGKTGLAIGMGREVIDKLGVKVFFITVVDFVEQIGRAWVAKDGSDYALLDRMKRRELLILNDLGAGHGTVKDWDDKSPMQHLFNVLEHRYNNDLPVVITSNCQGPAGLKAIVGERNINRIADSCKLFNCTGENLRKGVA